MGVQVEQKHTEIYASSPTPEPRRAKGTFEGNIHILGPAVALLRYHRLAKLTLMTKFYYNKIYHEKKSYMKWKY